MNVQEKYLARILLKNKIFEADKQEYENLFVKVMGLNSSTFKAVKPQGSIGDRKNDGFDSKSGTYYQVYAPEDLQGNEERTIKKLKEDFEGLYNHWNDPLSPIKFFKYVIKDNYKGAYPTVFSTLKSIQQQFKIETDAFLAKDLEQVVMNLSDDDLVAVVGIIPDPNLILSVEYNIVHEVIDYLMKFEAPYQPDTLPENPDFLNKISFNNLSKTVSIFLQNGRQQGYVIDDYFQYNSSYSKDEIKLRFIKLYEDGMNIMTDSETKTDEVFFYIAKEASPNKTSGVRSAVYVLMAYYFEYCDIFVASQL